MMKNAIAVIAGIYERWQQKSISNQCGQICECDYRAFRCAFFLPSDASFQSEGTLVGVSNGRQKRDKSQPHQKDFY